MPGVIAKPEDLEQFARELKGFSSQLRESMSRLNSQFKRLGDTWRDQEHARFAQEFEQTVRTLDSFLRSADLQEPLLKRKAQKLRDYLSQR